MESITLTLYSKNAPFELKEKILSCLEIELQKYRAIEYDYVLTKDNIDDWIEFVYSAIKSKRKENDKLDKAIKKFLDEWIIDNG